MWSACVRRNIGYSVLPAKVLEIRVDNTNPLIGTGSSIITTITYVYYNPLIGPRLTASL